MTRLTDETLMRYADGLLEPAEEERIARVAAQDPDARMRLVAFQATGRQLADLFDDFVRTPRPVPRWAAGPVAPVADPVQRAGADWKREARLLALAAWRGLAGSPLLAATLALIVGVGLGWLLRAGDTSRIEVASGLIESRGRQLIAQGALRQALETMPSGNRALSPQENERISVRLSFQNEAGAYCREYELNAGPSRHAGVACRTGESWSVAFQALVPPAPAAGSQIAPAGSSRSALDAATAALMIGDPLTRESEAQLLQKGWSK